jgi:hypothetical protein
VNVQDTDNQENGKKTENDGPDDAIGRAAVGNQFADETNDSSNENPDDNLRQ